MKQVNLSVWKERFKIFVNTISWAALVVLLFIASFLLYIGITTKLYEAKIIKREPKFFLYTIISPSMKPNLNVYDIIIDKKVTNINKVKKDDIITFISSSSLSQGLVVTHRVIEVIKDDDGSIKFKTKGDNNSTADSAYVTQPNLLGKVLYVIPQLGKVQYFVANKNGWLLVIVIPALIVLASYTIKLIRLTKIKEEIDKNNPTDQDKNKDDIPQDFTKNIIADEDVKNSFNNYIDNDMNSEEAKDKEESDI